MSSPTAIKRCNEELLSAIERVTSEFRSLEPFNSARPPAVILIKGKEVSPSSSATTLPNSVLNLLLRQGDADSRKLAALLMVLFRYLERVDMSTLTLVIHVIQNCNRQHMKNDSRFETLYEAIKVEARNASGERHWQHAVKIFEEKLHLWRKLGVNY